MNMLLPLLLIPYEYAVGGTFYRHKTDAGTSVMTKYMCAMGTADGCGYFLIDMEPFPVISIL
jgi:hypothetical protein